MQSTAHILRIAVSLILCNLVFGTTAGTALAQSDWKEWERTVQDAKKEGMIVAGIPARPELRKQLEAIFKPKFGIDMDLSPARGPQNASKIAAEYNAGVKNFDVFIGGSGTYESLVEAGMVEPFDALMILPEVKEAKNWWGGHIWEDNVKHQSLSLFLHCRCRHRRFLVQHPIGQAAGFSLAGRFAESQVERQDRISRPANSRLRAVDLVVSMGCQR